MLSRFVVAIVLSASLVTSALADDKPTKPTKPPQKGFASIKASDDHFVIRVSKPIHAKDFAGGFARLVLQKYEYRVPAGDYPVRFRSYADGREWFMIPMERWTGEFSGDATDVSEAVRGCPSRFTDYLAIDRETLRLEPYSYEVTEHSCSERGFKRQGGWEGPLVIVDAGEATIVDQATVDADLRVQAQLATDAAITAQRSEENLAPLKRRIGTKLCRDHKSMTFIGYTEAVSPDLDRIQIRVVAQTFGPPKHQPVPDYRPEIIWDAPINWRLCE